MEGKLSLSEKVMEQVKSHKRKLNGWRQCYKPCCRGICHMFSHYTILYACFTSHGLWEMQGEQLLRTDWGFHCLYLLFHWSRLKLASVGYLRNTSKQTASSHLMKLQFINTSFGVDQGSNFKIRCFKRQQSVNLTAWRPYAKLMKQMQLISAMQNI